MSFDFEMAGADVSLWTTDGGSAPSWFREINPYGLDSPFTLDELGYDSQTGLIELHLVAESDPEVTTYEDTKTIWRPTYDFEATLEYSVEDNGVYTLAYTLTDTVQYIIAPPNTFYHEMNQNQDLRQGLAAACVYGDLDAWQYCLEPQDDQLLERLGAGAHIRPTFHASTTDGYGSMLYRDFCDLDYKLSFRGTDPEQIVDWVTNAANGTGVASAHMINSVTLATYLAGVRADKPDEVGRAEGDKLKDHVTIVGHSLGGALASGAAMASGLPTATFNSAGLEAPLLVSVKDTMAPLLNDSDFIQDFDARITAWDVSHIIRFAEKYDILTALQTHIDLMPQAIGIPKPGGLPKPVSSIQMASQLDSYIEGLVVVFPGDPATGTPPTYATRYEVLVDGLESINTSLNNGTYASLSMAAAVIQVYLVSGPFVEVHGVDQYIFGILDGYGKAYMYE